MLLPQLLPRSLVAGLVALMLMFGAATGVSAHQIRGDQYWLDSLQFTQAWQLSTGQGVKVAVIDTGVDATHPDLVGAVINGVDESGHGAAGGDQPIGGTDRNHGTLVSSLLAARGHGSSNDEGVIGVAPDASLMPVSVWMTDPPEGTPGIDEQIAQGIVWAVDNGATVVNMSLVSTSPDWPESWDRAFQYAFDHDVVMVAAAGNRGDGISQVGAPATIPGVLTVAGVDRNNQVSRTASSAGITIGVSAPAEDLVGAYPGNRYAEWSGSSGATPLVSGLAALIRAKWPEMSADDVINRIVSTADDLGDPGQDPQYGYGLINPVKALTESVPTVPENPMGSLPDWVRMHRRAVGAAETAIPAPSTSTEPEGLQASASVPVPDSGKTATRQPVTTTVVPVVFWGGAVLAVGAVVAGASVHWRRSRRSYRSEPVNSEKT